MGFIMIDYKKIDPIIEKACKLLEKLSETKTVTSEDVEQLAKDLWLTLDDDIYDYYLETIYSNYNIA